MSSSLPADEAVTTTVVNGTPFTLPSRYKVGKVVS
jgi:hypothetical protein